MRIAPKLFPTLLLSAKTDHKTHTGSPGRPFTAAGDPRRRLGKVNKKLFVKDDAVSLSKTTNYVLSGFGGR